MLRKLNRPRRGSDLAGTLVRRDASNLPIAVIRSWCARAHEPQHVRTRLAIGYVGRLVPHKGLDILLQALAQQRGAKWRLDVARRARTGTARALASELRLAARVRWTGGLPAEQVANLWPASTSWCSRRGVGPIGAKPMARS